MWTDTFEKTAYWFDCLNKAIEALGSSRALASMTKPEDVSKAVIEVANDFYTKGLEKSGTF
jgi:hypothetical protein